ncbi:MAG: hypothetical protein HOC79_07185, partial [Euryarchaeota archaeon]|nr:hypothetical protein [Euryarchaeota archaeon]
RWDWNRLSTASFLPWREALIERFEDRWNWSNGFGRGLSGNETLPWSEALIERFEGRWDWRSLSGNKSIPWSETLLEHFADRWDWDGWRGVLYNKGVAKLFKTWTKQEISTALEAIKSAHAQ